MPTRQYIGARYVPKFYENGAWTANTAYEALTIVTRNGNSYTSKKPVPANIGAPENNPEYWVSTGVYNAQVQELSDRIDVNTADIENLENTKALNRKFILIGDSYAVGVYDGGIVNGWTHYFKDKLGLTEGVNCFTSAIGGSGFNDPDDTFLGLLQALNSTIDDKDSITDIVVAGGHNDTATINAAADAQYNALIAAITAFYNYARQNYKNARVWISYISKTMGQTQAWIERARFCKFAYQGDVNTLKYNIIPDIDLGLNIETYYYQPRNNQTDLVHCNQNGYMYIGYSLAGAVCGTNNEVFKTIRNGGLVPESYITVTSGDPRFLVFNNDVIFYTTDAGMQISIGDTKPTADSWYKIGEFPYPLWGANKLMTTMLCSGYIRNVSGGTQPRYVEFTGAMCIHLGSLFLRVDAINSAGNNFIDLSECDQITIRNTNPKIPLKSLF